MRAWASGLSGAWSDCAALVEEGGMPDLGDCARFRRRRVPRLPNLPNLPILPCPPLATVRGMGGSERRAISGIYARPNAVVVNCASSWWLTRSESAVCDEPAGLGSSSRRVTGRLRPDPSLQNAMFVVFVRRLRRTNDRCSRYAAGLMPLLRVVTHEALAADTVIVLARAPRSLSASGFLIEASPVLVANRCKHHRTFRRRLQTLPGGALGLVILESCEVVLV